MNFRLLFVHHPDTRIGQDSHIAVFIFEIQLRIGSNLNIGALQTFENIQGKNVLGLGRRTDNRGAILKRLRRLGNDIERCKSIRILDAKVSQQGAFYLQYFNFQHDFRFGAILSGNQFFGHMNGFRGVAHHQ